MNARSLSVETWRFRDAAKREWLPARVPGCVHTDLLAAGKIEDPFHGTNEAGLQWIEDTDWEFQTTFRLTTDELTSEVIELVADGLDTIATVTLNGVEIARTDNMFIGYRWDVTKHLRRGTNRLLVHFRSAMDVVRTTRTDFTPPREYCDPVGNSVRVRKQPCQFGWDWGPRLVTAGIWRDLRVERWTGNRLDRVHLRQSHHNGRVELQVTCDFAKEFVGGVVDVDVSLRGQSVVQGSGRGNVITVKIPHPELWWPAGQGAQPLYDVQVSARSIDGESVGSVTKRIGLRTLILDRHADEWGESFQFVVNGRPVFAKGANWIPAHSFVTALRRKGYARDLTAAVRANMNCIRLWGGGIYESEDFYDLCDELGLMVWHDFMFACALYPTDGAFLRSIKAEAEYQVRRIQHRACLALWCGNNELAQLNATALRADATLRKGYEELFHRLLPDVVSACDGVTSYWPSSEWRETYEVGHAFGEKSGDSHFWDVWHARHPVKDYEKWAFRFCSEFGMQSYSSPETNATFTNADDRNVFGPTMENHQKNRSGNQVILDYVSRRYRFPKSQDDLIYLSQLNQAYCMQVGVEHYRRLMPRCMGSLYWQLNDCWPVASWSSIEFTGRWKALHFAARRFYAPLLVSVKVCGDETTDIGNRRVNDITAVELFTVCDSPESTPAVLEWELRTFAGAKLRAGSRAVQLKSNQSIKQRTLSLKTELAEYGTDQIYLRVRLNVADTVVSEQSVFFAPPRFVGLRKARTGVFVTLRSPRIAMLSFRSNVFQHAFAFELTGLAHQASDNYFDLHPGERYTVDVTFARDVDRKAILAALVFRSLVDTYA